MKFPWPGMRFKSMRKINRIWIVAALTVALSLLLLIWISASSRPEVIRNLDESWVLRENRNGPVIGDLGGVPVSIPRPYANLVEYDGDPNFMEKRKGPPPRRTFQSRLRSFAFEIRYPDMAALTDETAKQKKLENSYTTMWLRVGLSSGSDYGSPEVLERHISRKINLKQTFPPYRYEKLPDPAFGLTVYAPVGFDEATRHSPSGGDYNDKNVYFHRNQDGKADAYIECSNAVHAGASCRLKFNLAPVMRANVSVSFRKGLLPHWQEIQSSVTQVILGFRAEPSSSTAQQGK